ncbi:MAG: metallopeptidase [Patescibacteria group bacterium]|nr:metallopeptidase [Patescibacteria group bacterium]
MNWIDAPDLKKELEDIVEKLGFKHIKTERIFCFRTRGAKARAYARIWGFPKIFQQVLGVEPAYVIEVLSEKFNRLSYDEKRKVIIHELLHIPKNFSGSLLPHKYGHTRINRDVEKLFKQLLEVEGKGSGFRNLTSMLRFSKERIYADLFAESPKKRVRRKRI